MKRTVALVGRPNVGKSTLFNRLTGTRDALVADYAGLTRDRRYGRVLRDSLDITLIDTGGLLGDESLRDALQQQTTTAVREADLVLLLLDGKAGVTASDQDVVELLRRQGALVVPVVNKIDGAQPDQALADFAELGLGELALVSAAHGRGMAQLWSRLEETLSALPDSNDLDTPASTALEGIHVAVIGRPNVGKSTLINRLLGEERQVVFDMPGTTMDAIDIPFERDGEQFVLIDTAGVRRKGKVTETAEKFSVVKALEAMRRAQVVVLVLDAAEGLVEQDLNVLRHSAEAGSGLVIAANKWDGLGETERKRFHAELDRRLEFVPWAPVHHISALHGSGVGWLWNSVAKVYAAGLLEVSTTELTRLLEGLVSAHAPPAVRGRHIKLKLAHKSGEHPPTITIHGNQVDSLPASYVRYLENGFREALDLVGNPVRLSLKTPKNPYAGRKNKLTPRQERRRKRIRKR